MLLTGDVMDVLPTLKADSFDAMLTDPPYGLSGDGGKTGFMGQEWDGRVPGPEVWRECLRVLKPGAFALVFGGTRTFHRLAVALEDAGFELRDTLMWVYGCLSEDTEILVDGKWEPYHKATKGRHALCYDTASGTLSWQPISELLVYDYEDTAYHIHSDSTDQIVSRNHRVIVERSGVERFELAENLAQEHEIRVPVLEGLRGVPGYLPLHDEGAGYSQRHVRESVPLQATQPQKGGHREAAPRAQRHDRGSLRGMRGDRVAAPLMAQESQAADVLEGVQRRFARPRVGQTRSQGAFGLDRGERAELPREDERSEQPSLEGWGHLLSQAWELCAHQVRALSARVRQHGPQRWVRHGTPLDRSAMPQPALAALGSGASHQSRPDGQPYREPDAVRLQPRAQAVRASRLTRTTLARIEPIHYTGKVWCVRVPTGAFVARRNGHIFVTGNSGFPKSHDVSKAIDKMAGAERKVIGSNPNHRAVSGVNYEGIYAGGNTGAAYITAPATPEAERWQGYGTSLKPAYEPVLLVRKPTPLTYAQNALEHGTGALNIDGARVPTNGERPRGSGSAAIGTAAYGDYYGCPEVVTPEAGRWPANLIHDGSDEVLELFPDNRPGMRTQRDHKTTKSNYFGADKHPGVRQGRNDSGSAARFFYAAKASSKERNAGLAERNRHPTIKPLALTEYLARLLLPPERGTPRRLLVPFAGSGSEMIGAWQAGWDEVVGIEREAEYVAIAERRIAHWLKEAA